MKIKLKMLWLALAVFTSMITACGGGGGGGDAGGNTPQAVTGVAATGKALANATVTLIDAKAVTKTATTSASGNFSINVDGLAAPFIIKVDAGAGKQLHSFSDGAGTANITPFSDLVVRSASGNTNIEINHSNIKTNIANSKSQYKIKFAPMLTLYAVPNDYDPLSSTFAIGNFLDKLFDKITVTIAADGKSATIINTETGSVIYTAPITVDGAFNGTVTNPNIPQPSPDKPAVATMKVYAGYRHSLALKIDGTVWAWGENSEGQIGDGTTTTRLTPVKVSGLSDIIDIGLGAYTSIALKKDGTIWVWGKDLLNTDPNTDIFNKTPQQLAGIAEVKAIATGYYHGVALKNDGTVWFWGRAESYDPLLKPTTPVQLIPFSGVKAITSRYALKTDGTLWALGIGAGNVQSEVSSSVSSLLQLGDDPYTDNQFAIKSDGTAWRITYLYPSKHQITTVTGIEALVRGPFIGGTNSIIALKSDKTVWAWNGIGAAAQIADLTSVSAISASTSQALAVKSDGTVWAWGENVPLGNGNTNPSQTPVQVTGLLLK